MTHLTVWTAEGESPGMEFAEPVSIGFRQAPDAMQTNNLILGLFDLRGRHVASVALRDFEARELALELLAFANATQAGVN
jgi:hypothetical protein